MLTANNEGHLSPEDLSGYLDDAGTPEERERVERHLDECEACRREAVETYRIVTRARASGPWWRTVRHRLPAVAALVILCGGVVLSRGGTGRTTVMRADSTGATEGLADVEVVSPGDGAVVPPVGLEFVWRSEGEGAFYRFALMDDVGNVVWRVGTADTVARPGAEVALEGGHDYFWIVDALLNGGRTGTSGARAFRVASP